jgi:hypothetical protein
MTKTRHRFLGYAVVLIPLVLIFFSPFSESIRQRLLRQYDVRWHLVYDEALRTQTITIRNNGDAAVPDVRIKLNIQTDAPRPLGDFAYAPMGTPRQSFFDSISNSESLKIWSETDSGKEVSKDPNPSGLDKLAAVIDEHSTSRNLHTLDQELDGLLVSKLRKETVPAKIVDEFNSISKNCSAWHHILLQKCKDGTYAADLCRRATNIIGAWELSKRDLQEKARSKWYEMTGVRVTNKSSLMSPSGEMDFAVGVRGNETSRLHINYNQDPSISMQTSAQVFSDSVGQITQVKAESDLNMPLLLFLLKYQQGKVALVLFGAVLLLSFAWPEIRPKKLLPVHRVFNLALSTDDHEYWEHAYQRHRFYILQQFRELRQTYGRMDLNPEPEEILDYVRSKLITRHQANPGRPWKIRTEQKLNLFIRTHLKTLVLLPS